MREIKVIPGFSGYGVDGTGRIFSRVIKFRPGQFRDSWRELKTEESRGYRRVVLVSDDGVKHRMSVHRLVVSVFIGPIPEGWEVNHRDFDRGNNTVENLEIVTSSGNKIHSAKHGRAPRAAGERNGQAKLSPAEVAEIRRRRDGRETQASIARDFNVSQGMVSLITRGLRWTEAEP